MDEYWNNFLKSGKVEDYIKYVNNYYTSVKNEKQETNDAADGQGTYNTRTDYRGE